MGRYSLCYLTVLLLTTALATAPASAQVTFTLEPESKVWIEGSSNVSAFTCRSSDAQGGGAVSPGFPASMPALNEETAIGLEMTLPVRSLDCGNRQMNTDLFGAMRADRYPQVVFRLSEVKPAGTASGGESWVRMKAVGRLRLAGVERPAEIALIARRISGDQFRLRGSTALRMTDFGIEPPTAMLGLVKARDALTVHFDLISSERPVPYASAR